MEVEREFPRMETVLDSETSPGSTVSIDQAIEIKAASAPAIPGTPSDEKLIKPQISAPSYLNSLRENDDPPFRKPDNEPKPCIIIGTIMREADAVAMIAAGEADKANGLKKFLGKLSVSYVHITFVMRS